MSRPLVAVCIPAYNVGKTIAKTLDSILNQTYENLEVHVFDNASSDDTLAVVKAYEDERLHIHTAESTTDAETNFTRCLMFGRGEYTAIYHADDLYAEEMIEKEVEFLEANIDAGGVLTAAQFIGASGEYISTHYLPQELNLDVGGSGCYNHVELFKVVLNRRNYLFCPSAMIRTNICTDHLKQWRGALFKSSADLDVWLRIAEGYQLGLINQPLLHYRLSPEQYSSQYNTGRTDRADMFKALDFWMNNESIRKSLSRADWRNYNGLVAQDDLVCAANAWNQNDVEQAKMITSRISLRALLVKALLSIGNLKFFMFAIVVKLAAMPVIGILFLPLIKLYRYGLRTGLSNG